MTSADRPSRLVAGRYRLGAVLGRGAMGTVWAAHDEVLGRPVAVKEVLLPPGIPDAEADVLRERSLREARAIAALSHPNVITLYDVARQHGEPFVVMELVPSNSLAELLRTGALPPDRVIAVGAAVAAALQAAHAAGITHRDVKPGNVLVAHDGRIKLTDFGIARNPADQTMTATGVMLGSPAYIAPEIASGGLVSPAADLWGLGATLFAAVEGRPPYDGGDPLTTISSVVLGEVPAPSCSGPLAEVISGLMVKDPAARMPLSDVLTLLGSPQGGVPTAEPRGPLTPARPRGARQPPRPPTGQLATDPGPLPFAVHPAHDPADHGTASPTDRGTRSDRDTRPGAFRTAVLWTLAALLFLGTGVAGFAAARIAGGDSPFPGLGAFSDHGATPSTTTRDPVPQARVFRVTEADGSQPAQFTIDVPEGWLEFREHGVLGDDSGAVVRFVSPDGAQVIAVERVTDFLAQHVTEDYLDAYRRTLAALPQLVESGRVERGNGVLDVAFRSREGRLRRTAMLRLVPVRSDLWVVRVTVPTEQESVGRELFDRVVAGFKPGS